MGGQGPVVKKARERLLDPVERVSEFLFGLFMALTFVGAVSVATDGKAEIRTMFIAALGCNLAWGLVDGVMYVVQSVVARGRSYTLALAVRTAQAEAGRDIIEGSLPQGLAGLVSTAEIEAIRARLVALTPVAGTTGAAARRPARRARHIPHVRHRDLSGGAALHVHRATWERQRRYPAAVALAMLFLGGLALGRYAGYGSWKAGLHHDDAGHAAGGRDHGAGRMKRVLAAECSAQWLRWGAALRVSVHAGAG